MVNQGTLAPEVRQAAIETLKTIGKYGKSRNVFVTMENRGGGRAPCYAACCNKLHARAPAPHAAESSHPPGATWEVVVEVIKAAGI